MPDADNLKTFTCPSGGRDFRCGTDSFQCVSDLLICDEVPDCFNGADESAELCDCEFCSTIVSAVLRVFHNFFCSCKIVKEIVNMYYLHSTSGVKPLLATTRWRMTAPLFLIIGQYVSAS